MLVTTRVSSLSAHILWRFLAAALSASSQPRDEDEAFISVILENWGCQGFDFLHLTGSKLQSARYIKLLILRTIDGESVAFVTSSGIANSLDRALTLFLTYLTLLVLVTTEDSPFCNKICGHRIARVYIGILDLLAREATVVCSMVLPWFSNRTRNLDMFTLSKKRRLICANLKPLQATARLSSKAASLALHRHACATLDTTHFSGHPYRWHRKA